MMEVSVIRNAVLRDRNFSSTDSSGQVKSSQDNREIPGGY